MEVGLPILFSGSGEGAAIIKENELGWVSPVGDWALLEQSINQFKLLSERKLNDMRTKARQTALEKFDRTKLVGEFHLALMAGLK